jgi:hypothetical protein
VSRQRSPAAVGYLAGVGDLSAATATLAAGVPIGRALIGELFSRELARYLP